ncbi:G-type lectin S-receptor-like serine/threonine-protein kinase RLK1 [Ziziphus jujuba]|uniref:G-type lectin S-receptor-like serine/threonine-protein kinase RLK1 n=1 Tax=Ziziphus jujuba TaxID=326968 RepID=A0A6P4AJY5_ZIZJJ|nr:G-type lectin S-receptor-like serine/threonine-protein kinase RLK1 [Ziziphus jujuba]
MENHNINTEQCMLRRKRRNGRWSMWIQSICSIQSDGRTNCRCSDGYLMEGQDKLQMLRWLSDGRTNCRCSDGYSLFNPTDAYSGCRPNFILGCNSSSGQIHQENHFMQEISNVNFPFSDYEVLSSISRESCKNACLRAAVIFGPHTMRCWKKRPPLSDGKVEFNAIAYLKTANIPQKDQSIVVFLPSSVLSGHSELVYYVIMSAILVGSLYLKRKVLEVEVSPNESRLQQFTYKELTKATNGFKVELGRGSSEIVYRGKTRSTGLIAVKMLDRVFENNNTKFKREVNIIGQTNHKKLVRLVGYCEEKRHRKQIIHCDIKPGNILLDENDDARISDFGLANLLPRNQINTKTKIRGTEGYVALEWIRAGPVSVKVDVYSFGVVLLEIICSRRNEDLETDGKFFIKWVYDCCSKGELGDLVKNDKEAMDDIKMVERFVKVAIWCVQDDPHVRPTMKKVMLMLEEILQVSVAPRPFSSSSIEIEDIVSGI